MIRLLFVWQHVLHAHGGGHLQPLPGSDDHATFLQWCWFAEATFSRATGEIANHRRAFAGALLEPVVEEMRSRARACMHALDAEIATKPYLLGDTFTAADVMMGYALQSYERNVGEAMPPHADVYFKQRLMARPAYEAASEAELRM